MIHDEPEQVIAAFRGTDFRLTHSNPNFHETHYRIVGRPNTMVAAVDVRFNTLAEVRDLVWESPAHALMPGVLHYATQHRVFNGGVLGGYAAVQTYFRRKWWGIRRLNVLALCRELDIAPDQRSAWLEGARAYIALFWQTCEHRSASAAD
ncbi:hypothetical protein GO986_12250 [Deinococcus sp. HMF7620]|uniref:Uncharacterized protein n=1 Tax=Deinococcus arboris TaxID=2682977 RepID=A0A7C9LMR3_9DEIO|nr:MULTISPECIES: hypothetical protein [Deinococcus]MBZ9752209.1 hypothetical protein [Deinococcus betulae]MVN87537.1 hypothetical protein [Deinococcus arboris]